MNVGGLIKYIKYLPVLKKVENSFSEYITSVKTETNQIIYPSDRAVTATSRLLGDTSTVTCIQCKKEFTYENKNSRRKYCSDACRNIVIKRRRNYVTNEEKERFCIVCENPMPLGTDIICSDECKSINIKNYKYTKNPFPLKSLTENRYPHEPNVMPTHYVDPEILEQAILYTDCATDMQNNGHACAIYEDIEELDRIMMYELGMKPTHYEKRPNAKWSGRNYQSVKAARNYRRKQLGLPKIPSIKTSNLEKQLAETNERRRGLRPKLQLSEKELMYRAEEAGITGFATITPMKTKKGKLVNELLDEISKKKAIGQH
jgi:predicted nucleic acid-binding Zn ribbon protein